MPARGRPATGADPTITLRFPAHLAGPIEARAAELKTTRSAVIRTAVREYLERNRP